MSRAGQRWIEYAGERFRVQLTFAGQVQVCRLGWGHGLVFGLGEDGKLVGTAGCRFEPNDPLLVHAQEFCGSGEAEREDLDRGTRWFRYATPADWYAPPAVMGTSNVHFNHHEMITAKLVWAPKMKRPRLEDTTMVHGLREKVLSAAIELATSDEAGTGGWG